MNENYITKTLAPFGLLIISKDTLSDLSVFKPKQIMGWINQHQIVVFRGFKSMNKQPFALYAQKLGKPFQWPFGAINDLIVKPETENYIYTANKVPLHWDGAFVKKIPHLILFQCIKAPPSGSFGGTTFCNTIKVVESMDTQTKKKWSNISIKYTTEKKVHYGGEITQNLLDKHPVTNQDILRYAEPVNDLNPVFLEVNGNKDEDQDLFIENMEKTLYNKAFVYTHHWQDGDFVIADNFALLHGREAFTGDNNRYIQRINLLARPANKSLARFIENSLLIRRKEFFIAEIPILIIPVLMSLSTWSDLFQLPFLLGFMAVFLLFNIGDMINCYADYKLDAVYKSHLSNAVFELGKQNVLKQIVLSTVLALFLTSLVAHLTSQYYLLPLTLVGLFIGLQYSIPPFKFKSRGVLQFFCLLGILFLGPMLFVSIITNGIPTLPIMLFFILYGVHQMGIILFNTAEDFIEDKMDGLNTIVIRLGLHRSLHWAWYSIAFAGCAIQILLVYVYQNLLLNISWYLTIGIFTVGWLIILFETKQILHKIKGEGDKQATDILKANGMKVPRWLNIGAYSLFVVIGIFVFNKLSL